MDSFIKNIYYVNLIGEREDRLLWRIRMKGGSMMFFYNSKCLEGHTIFPVKEVQGLCAL